MPRLPAPEDYGQTAPRPSRGVTEISPVTVRPNLATGKALQDIGEIMQQEADKLDETVALDALNQLQNKQLELTYGDSGFTKIQGRGVIDGKITDAFPTQLQSEVERLGASIQSAKAKQRFQAQAAAVVRQFKGGVYAHAAKETETFHTQTDNAVFATAQGMAARGDLEGALAYAAPALQRATARNNLEGDAAAEFTKKALGPVYVAAIDGALQKGDSATAMSLFDSGKGFLTPQQLEHYGARVKSKNDYVGGLALSQEVRERGLKGQAARDYIQTKANGNKEMANEALVDLKQREAEDKVAREELIGEAEKAFIDGGLTFKAAQLAAQSPAFGKLPIDEQSKLRKSWEASARGTLAFGQHQQDRAEAKKQEDPAVMEQYLALVNNPQALVRYTDGQLFSMRQTLGARTVQQIVQFKHQTDSVAKKFKIPEAFIEQAMPPELQKPKTGLQAQQKDRFKGAVEEYLIDWKLENPGTVPDEAVQKQIVEKASRSVTTKSSFFGIKFTGEEPTYKLKPLPSDFVTQQQAVARAKLGRELTRDELIASWARNPGSKY